LNGRGIRDAHRVASYLFKEFEGAKGVYLVSSSATRALHTALIFAENFGIPSGTIKVQEQLYHASSRELMNAVRTLPNACQKVFLFAHNPGITDFLSEFGGLPVENVPTTGVAGVAFDVDHWEQIGAPGNCFLYEYPKGLK
jgi:phosphohistidine phosphatase